MPDTTVNYGFRIPKSDGSDYQVPDDIRIPVTAIDTKLKAVADTILVPLVDTGWLPLTGIQSFFSGGSAVGFAISVRRVGQLVAFRGTQRANAATISAGTSLMIGTLPADMWPSTNNSFTVVGWINGGTNQRCDASVNTIGQVRIDPNVVFTGVYFGCVSFLIG